MQHASLSSLAPSAEDGPRLAAGRFTLDGWVVDPATGFMQRDEQSVHLVPKLMQVLVYLAQHPGQVVSRAELEAEIWKNTVVSYDAVTGAIQKLRKVFNDDPRHPHVIETLSKRGYRLIAQVSWMDSHDAPVSEYNAAMAETGVARRERRYWQVTALSLLLLAFGALLLISQRQSVDNMSYIESVPISIAVLPFDNPESDIDQDHFIDGIVDDLTTNLARHPGLLVISRESAFHYKNTSLDIPQIADSLGVRYLLHGTVRRHPEFTRLNVHLTDTSTSALLWAQSYDVRMSDFFSLQGEIIEKIISTLVTKDGPGYQQDFGMPLTDNLHAYDSYLFGRQLFYTFASKEENRKARKYFRKAIEYDPDFAMAYSMLAWTHAFDAMNGWSEIRAESLAGARKITSKALSLDPSMPVAYFVRGLTYRETGDYVKALVEAEKAIEHDPNYANAHVLLATLLYYAGRPEEGLQRIIKAMQLNPHHPYNYSFHLGQAHFILGDYENAISAFRKGIASNPAAERLHVWLAAAYAQHDMMDDAGWEVDQVLMLNPEFSIQRMQDTFPFKYKDDRQHFLAALQKAGLPH